MMSHFIQVFAGRAENKLQTAILEFLMKYHNASTDKTHSDWLVFMRVRIESFNRAYPKCKPLEASFSSDNEAIYIGLPMQEGKWITLLFSKVRGRVEANFNVQQEI